MPLVEIKNFNALIDNKAFFDQPIQNKQEAYEKLIQMSRNDDYTTVNLLFTVKFINSTLFRFIKIQTNTNIDQQINFTGKLEEGDSVIMFLYC